MATETLKYDETLSLKITSMGDFPKSTTATKFFIDGKEVSLVIAKAHVKNNGPTRGAFAMLKDEEKLVFVLFGLFTKTASNTEVQINETTSAMVITEFAKHVATINPQYREATNKTFTYNTFNNIARSQAARMEHFKGYLAIAVQMFPVYHYLFKIATLYTPDYAADVCDAVATGGHVIKRTKKVYYAMLVIANLTYKVTQEDADLVKSQIDFIGSSLTNGLAHALKMNWIDFADIDPIGITINTKIYKNRAGSDVVRKYSFWCGYNEIIEGQFEIVNVPHRSGHIDYPEFLYAMSKALSTAQTGKQAGKGTIALSEGGANRKGKTDIVFSSKQIDAKQNLIDLAKGANNWMEYNDLKKLKAINKAGGDPKKKTSETTVE